MALSWATQPDAKNLRREEKNTFDEKKDGPYIVTHKVKPEKGNANPVTVGILLRMSHTDAAAVESVKVDNTEAGRAPEAVSRPFCLP